MTDSPIQSAFANPFLQRKINGPGSDLPSLGLSKPCIKSSLIRIDDVGIPLYKLINESSILSSFDRQSNCIPFCISSNQPRSTVGNVILLVDGL